MTEPDETAEAVVPNANAEVEEAATEAQAAPDAAEDAPAAEDAGAEA